MKIATYNVNGVNGRLPVLLHWPEDDEPDIVCLQELKEEARGQLGKPSETTLLVDYGLAGLEQPGR